MKKVKVMFHISTNKVGSEMEEEQEFEFPDDLPETKMYKAINDEYNEWLGSQTDQSWWIID